MRCINYIMLVEDDIVDRMSVRRAFSELGVQYPLIEAEDGEQALMYLRGATNPKPAVILLDLNMPRMSGIEFLREIKSDSFLKYIPVVILTTSKEDIDKRNAFGLGAAGYLIKPIGYEEIVAMMKTVIDYWKINELCI